MTTTCVLASCGSPDPVTEPGTYTCARCGRHLVRQLGEIETYLEHLTPAPTKGGPSRRSPGFASTAPLRIAVAAMLDERTTITGDGPDDIVDEVPNLIADITNWAQLLLDEHPERLDIPATLGGATRLLRTRVDWITRQPWVDEFAEDMRRVHGVLRSTTDYNQGAVHVPAPCPSCGLATLLRSVGDQGDDSIRCRYCWHLIAAEHYPFYARLVVDAMIGDTPGVP